MPEWTLLVVVSIAGWTLVSVLVGVIVGPLLHRLFAEPERDRGQTRRVVRGRRVLARLKERRAA